MRNDYVEELLKRMQNRYSIDTLDMPMGEWLCRNTTLKGAPFNFSRYPFQRAIADDLHGNLDVIKPSQIGLSEIQFRKSLGFLARNQGTVLIFTFPLEKMFKKQSMTRIKPIVDEDRVFNMETRSGEKPVRSMGLYQIGTSFMHVTNAREGDATSISADVVMNDEVDLTDQQMLALFNSRMQNSDWKINQRFSTPTFTHYGVDKGIKSSDQHVYLCKCDACRHWNEPTFDFPFIEIPGLPSDLNSLTEINTELIDNSDIDLVNAFVKCEKCGAPLDLGREENREWVPKYPSRDHHRGYLVSPFSTDRLSISYIVNQLLRYQSRDYIRGWYNTVLGLAYTAGNARLSDNDIDACFTGQTSVPTVDPHAPTWIGIDVGQTCHMIVGQGTSPRDMHCILFETVPVNSLLERVEELTNTYNVVGGACDRFPYTPTADALYEQTQGRIVPVEYRGQKEINLVRDDVTKEVTHAQMNRTHLIDTFVAGVRKKYVRFSGYGDQRGEIKEHLKDMVREESAEVEAKWVKLTGNDHFFHAGGFLLAGPKLKDIEFQLYTDPRSVVAVGGARLQSPQGKLGTTKSSGGGLLR